MELRDADQNVIDKNPTAETLIIGPESVDLHLNTKSEIDCVHCYDDAFFGLPLDQVRFFWPHFSGRSLEGWQLPSQNFVLQRVEFYNFAISKIFTSIRHPRTKFLTPSLHF